MSIGILFSVWNNNKKLHNNNESGEARCGTSVHKRVHRVFFFVTFCGCRTARIASSNTVFSPFCVRAEHSRYLTAPISFCICRPWRQRIEGGCKDAMHSLIQFYTCASNYMTIRCTFEKCHVHVHVYVMNHNSLGHKQPCNVHRSH